MTDPKPEAALFKEEVSLVCKCGQHVSIGYVDDVPTGLHAVPECAEFIRLDLIDFLRWNRGATEN